MEDPKNTLSARFARAYARMAGDTLRRAMAGDEDAAYAVVWLVMGRLQSYSLPPRKLHDFFLEVLNDPDRYARIMSQAKPKKRRGRPSIDDKPLVSLPPGLVFKKYFGRLPTEENALMIAYLLSQGYLINESGKHRESAVQMLSALLGRSERALQADYYKHRDRLTPGSIVLGEALYTGKLYMHENFRKSRK